MLRMKIALTIALWFVGALVLWTSVAGHSTAADVKKLSYPEARFPANLKNPKTVADVMPYARALARNKANIIGLGLGVLRPGEKAILVANAMAGDIYVEAMVKALAERKVEAIVMHDYEIAGVSRDEALALSKALSEGYTAEQGYREGCGWANFGRDWLEAHHPDLAETCYPKKMTKDLPDNLKATREKLAAGGGEGPGLVVSYLLKYMEQHPDVRGVYYGRAGPIWMSFHPHEDKWLGVFVMDNRWDVMAGNSSYPSDLWLLTEEQTMEPLASVDKVHVTDPEGTDVNWEMSEDQAQRWSKGVYLRGHLFMFPNETYGQYALSVVNYPAMDKDYIPLEPIVLINGTIAGTKGHGGFFPRIEEHFKDGYLTDVKGGGLYGELLRTFLKEYPKINETTYPQFKHPGYFYHFETALGTNPKVIRHALTTQFGTLPERMHSGAIHWALGAHYWNDPATNGGRSDTIKLFAKQNKLPPEHGFHIHSYYNTYQVHLRNTNKWISLVDKGRLTSLDSPQTRALASRYGNPDKLLAEDWFEEIPGISVPGNYDDYAKDPYKYSKAVMDKIEAGTYEHYYPSNAKSAPAAKK